METSFKSKDGTEVHGFLLNPTRRAGGSHLPDDPAQFMAGRNRNIRWLSASNGRYSPRMATPSSPPIRAAARAAARLTPPAIYANWGGPDVQDELAAVDDAVRRGVADPNRLGVGGWSYGGMLTNYVIASDTRFKAATSGASIANILGGYGNDQYAHDYETELGLPWKTTAVWEKISYPFLHADRIKTPTMFQGGDKDMNVPLHNGEQMYQALRSLGIDTQLIVYPGQFHGLTVPSYRRDVLQRYIDCVR